MNSVAVSLSTLCNSFHFSIAAKTNWLLLLMRGTMKETSLSELAFFHFNIAKFFFVVHSMNPLKKKSRYFTFAFTTHSEHEKWNLDERNKKKSFSIFYECNKFSQIFFSPLSAYCCRSWTSLSHTDGVISQWKTCMICSELPSTFINWEVHKEKFLTGKKHQRSHFALKKREKKLQKSSRKGG